MAVLIADDDPAIRTSAEMLLRRETLDTISVSSPAQVLEVLDRQEVDIALLDMNYSLDTTSGMEGLDLISAVRAHSPLLPVVVMTGWGNVSLAVEAMRRGAADFIEKPWSNERLLAILRSQLKLAKSQRLESKLKAENRLLRQALCPEHEMIAESPLMQTLLEDAQRVASSDMPVLITGENGTGKNLLAQFIHANSSRAAQPLVTVNMGGVAEHAFESEMFGHVRGAYTDARDERIGRLEMAEGGSLFLDEIANTPTGQQAKLLRLLEQREYEKLGSSRTRRADVRIIAATNADLESAISEGGFRQDLFYRLNGVELRIPALRNRPQDIHLIAQIALRDARARFNTPAKQFSASAIEALTNYDWPGNIRELRHLVERAVLLARDPTLQIEDLQLNSTVASKTANGDLKNLTLDQAELRLISSALERHQGKVEDAAQALGLSRSALYRRLEKYGLNV